MKFNFYSNIVSKWEEEQELNSFCYGNELLKQIILSKRRGQISDKLGSQFYEMANKIVDLNYINNLKYFVKQEIISAAVFDACIYYKNFDEHKCLDPKMYILQIMKSAIVKHYYKFKRIADEKIVHI